MEGVLTVGGEDAWGHTFLSRESKVMKKFSCVCEFVGAAALALAIGSPVHAEEAEDLGTEVVELVVLEPVEVGEGEPLMIEEASEEYVEEAYEEPTDEGVEIEDPGLKGDGEEISYPEGEEGGPFVRYDGGEEAEVGGDAECPECVYYTLANFRGDAENDSGAAEAAPDHDGILRTTDLGTQIGELDDEPSAGGDVTAVGPAGVGATAFSSGDALSKAIP